MKSNLALLLFLLPFTSGLATPASTPPQPATTEQNEALSPVEILSAQIKEIASSDATSRKTQAKLITKAVRLAVVSAIEGIKDPAERLKVASELATAAAKAAPHFAATISSAISDIPSIAEIDGGAKQIASAISAGLESAEETAIANPVVNPPRPPANPEFGGPNNSETIVSPSH